MRFTCGVEAKTNEIGRVDMDKVISRGVFSLAAVLAVAFGSMTVAPMMATFDAQPAYAQSTYADAPGRDDVVSDAPIPEHAGLEHANLDMSPYEAFPIDAYYVSNYLSEEGKKAWILTVNTLLSYTEDKAIVQDNGTFMEVNYEAAGIRPTTGDVATIRRYLRDYSEQNGVPQMPASDPRLFLLSRQRLWEGEGSEKDGIQLTQKFGIDYRWKNGTRYRDAVAQIEEKAKAIIAGAVKGDMTIYQQISAVQKAYEASVTYKTPVEHETDIIGSLINGVASCGGYSMGWQYLLMHLGVQNVYVDGTISWGGYPYDHAWNYVKVEGRWYVCDTTWGRVSGTESWCLVGSNYSDWDHSFTKYYLVGTYIDKLDLSLVEKGSVPLDWLRYPSLTLDVSESVQVLQGSDFDLKSLVSGYSSIYGENLEDHLSFTVGAPTTMRAASAFDTSEVGSYPVTVTLTDDHGNSASAEVRVNVVAEDVTEYGETVDFTLLEGGKEVPYTTGYRINNGGNLVINLPAADVDAVRTFSAKVGIIGSVRQEAHGAIAHARFRVEFLDRNYDVLSQSETGDFGWQTPAGILEAEVPAGAVQARLTTVAVSGGYNHGGWVDVSVTSHIERKASSVTISGLDGLTFATDMVVTPVVTVTGSGAEARLTWEYQDANGIWVELAGPPVNAGHYRVTAYVPGQGAYMSATAVQEFTIAPRKGPGLLLPASVNEADLEGLSHIAVTDGATTLVQGRDYDLVVERSGDTAVVTVTFKGNYAGTFVGTVAVTSEGGSGGGGDTGAGGDGDSDGNGGDAGNNGGAGNDDGGDSGDNGGSGDGGNADNGGNVGDSGNNGNNGNNGGDNNDSANSSGNSSAGDSAGKADGAAAAAEKARPLPAAGDSAAEAAPLLAALALAATTAAAFARREARRAR